MPMMKGIKFACEPCIRGHRSSKCNHSDRVLVQVRKPGRPLSSCPHTLSSSSPGTFVHSAVPAGTAKENGANGNDACGGINCSCDVTSVAIPKIASCACGTSKHRESPPRRPSLSIAPSLSRSPPAASHSTLVASPISPTSPTIASASSLINGSANRICKPQRSKKRNGSAGGAGDGPGRRSSFIAGGAALELLLEKERERSASIESVKMEKAGSCCGLAGTPNGNDHANGHMNEHAVAQGFVPIFSSSIENGADQFHPQQQHFPHVQSGRVAVGDLKPASIINGNSGLKLDMDIDGVLSLDNWSSEGNGSPPWAGTSKKTVCCGNKSSHTQLLHQNLHQAPSNSQTHPCCGGACSNGSMKPLLPVQQQPVSIPLAPYGTGQFYPPPQYPPPPYMATSNFQQTAPVWPYPASTINHPLTPQELAWLQQQRAAGVFGQPPPGTIAMPPPPSGAQVDSWAHACNCGPSCDCLGCATHPFNRRTVEYVKGIQQFMEGDYHPHSPHSSSHSRIFSPQLSQTQAQQNVFGNNAPASPPPTHPTNTPSTTVDVFSSNATAQAPAILSPCHNSAPYTPEEHNSQQLSPSPSQDDETGAGATPGGTDTGGDLSPSNFFYVDYPFGTCAQTETGCKCGEGCTCVGCLTHGGHDGVVLDGNVGEGGQWGW